MSRYAPSMSLKISHTVPRVPITMDRETVQQVLRADPFVVGYLLTKDQGRMLAEYICTEEELRDCGPNYATAASRALKRLKRKQCCLALRFEDEGPPVLGTFWVRSVCPSFDGKNPNPIIPLMDVEKTFPGLDFGEVKTLCLRWPPQFDEPDWLRPRMVTVIQMMENRKEAERIAAEQRCDAL
ncbi:hypothetical protein CYLTODRAFT_423735 [Cylindrobasidium torrendii FP15055 ss-10]|uniref:Uncharacterized protein n=1 Tax=Cylindrobasidium torrendii FP15055 ss-10 TaxID=1314674 RepID=A0A0D7B6J0_9AGAR|nr:hypothetical protein CYLTODRAFT_423735 [Cylindrobasidium torrendii FP15055 ss-10]